MIVGRRATLDLTSLAALLAFSLPSKPAIAVLDPNALRGPGTAGFSAWGEPWSDTCSWSSRPPAISSEAPLPEWLAGQWRVSSKLEGVRLPLGRSFLSETAPGVRMVSILPLPNIGATPDFMLSFDKSRDGVFPNRALNAKTTLEAFWPDANVTVAESSATSPGRVLLSYESPTRSGKRLGQRVDLHLCASDSLPSAWGDETIVQEVFQQDNIEQGVRTHFLVLQSFTREGDTGKIRSKQRVAAFLQPSDGRYFDARGQPIAIYDYSFRLSPLVP